MLHAWTLQYQHDTLRLTVDAYEGRKPMARWRKPRHQIALATSGTTKFRRMPTPYRYLRCGDLRSPGVTERHNGPLGLRDDDDDESLLAQAMGSC